MGDANGNGAGLVILIARFLGRIIMTIESGANALYDGIIPPLLGYRGLEKLVELDYNGESTYVGAEYNTSGFFRWELGALGSFEIESKRFMVLAAGGGREAIALLRRGALVDAWECNEKLRNFGNKLLEGESLPCRIQAMEPSVFPRIPQGRTYDFCIVGWSAYSHILRREDRIALLSSIRDVVKGPVLISFVGIKNRSKLTNMLRSIVSSLPGSARGVSHNLHARPGTIRVGFNENDIREEAGSAGLEVEVYNNRHQDYPFALLVPKKEGKSESRV